MQHPQKKKKKKKGIYLKKKILGEILGSTELLERLRDSLASLLNPNYEVHPHIQ